MEIVVTGRHCEVTERFRAHLAEKLEKVAQLEPRVLRVDVELSHERNRRQSSQCDRVEITVLAKGPVIRAEACADEPYAALDLAHAKLLERLRRSRDRRKVHHGRHNPPTIREGAVMAVLPEASANGSQPPENPAGIDDGDSPVVIREKVHPAIPMTLDQALYEMELVGHDFFLFVDAATGRPSVVYRRKGWSYGVIALDGAAEAVSAGEAGARERQRMATA